MKIDQETLAELIEFIYEWSDFEVERQGYDDFQVSPDINPSMKTDMLEEVNKILNPKKWWQFWR